MYKVLIADDEPIMCKALMTLVDWKSAECEVLKSDYDGQAVLDALSDLKPDILVLDIKMPLVSGLEVAQQVYERKLPIKVILLTAYTDFSYAHQAIRYGVD